MGSRALMMLAAATLGAAGCYASHAPPGSASADAGRPFDAAGVDSGPRSPFTGTYEGTYTGEETGALFLEIRADGTLTIEIRSPRGVERHDGTIRVDGALNAAGRIGALMVRFTGRFTGEPGAHVGTGEWRIEGAGASGTWELHQVA